MDSCGYCLPVVVSGYSHAEYTSSSILYADQGRPGEPKLLKAITVMLRSWQKLTSFVCWKYGLISTYRQPHNNTCTVDSDMTITVVVQWSNCSRRKLCYRKDDRAMRMVPWKFSWLPDYAHGVVFPTFSWAFVPIHPMNVPSKFEVCSFTRSWYNRGYSKIGQSLDTPTLPFLQNF